MFWKFAPPVVASIFALLLSGAGASDAEFNKALKEAKCVPARVSILSDEKEVKVYEITCLGNPPRKVGMFCTRSACSVSSEDAEPDRGPAR